MTRSLLFALVLAHPLGAAVYVPPDDGRALFRRDLLPLDTDTMRELSGHLTELARRDLGQDPAQWRANAQLLAIAVRLDPANRPARDLGRRLAAGELRPPPTGVDLERALASIWRVVAWLVQPEAGREGQLLGHQLLDALHVIDPRHPLAKLHHAAGEAARWRGVVADLSRFEAPNPPPPPTPPTPAPADENEAPSPLPTPARSVPEPAPARRSSP